MNRFLILLLTSLLIGCAAAPKNDPMVKMVNGQRYQWTENSWMVDTRK